MAGVDTEPGGTDPGGTDPGGTDPDGAGGGSGRVADDLDVVDVFVEVPMGSRNKYEWDFARNAMVLDRTLYSAVQYPGDYGFVPDTLARDGDHLDALCILGVPTFPGCTVAARIVGVLDMRDEAGPDEKLLVVAENDPRWRGLRELEDVPQHLLDEIAQFFATYKELEAKEVVVDGWRDRAHAHDVLADARRRYVGVPPSRRYPT